MRATEKILLRNRRRVRRCRVFQAVILLVIGSLSLWAVPHFGLGAINAGLGGDTRLPEGAATFETPEVYQEWWRSTEECSGLTGDFGRVIWYVVPNARRMDTEIGAKVGLWQRTNGRSAITLAGDYRDSELVVRHEMLHELIGVEGHPNELFEERCRLTWATFQNEESASVPLELPPFVVSDIQMRAQGGPLPVFIVYPQEY